MNRDFYCASSVKVEEYFCNDGFRFDIVKKLGSDEVWLFHEDYGVKMLMFGIESGDLMCLIRYSIDEYKRIYKDLYMI